MMLMWLSLTTPIVGVIGLYFYCKYPRFEVAANRNDNVCKYARAKVGIIFKLATALRKITGKEKALV